MLSSVELLKLKPLAKLFLIPENYLKFESLNPVIDRCQIQINPQFSLGRARAMKLTERNNGRQINKKGEESKNNHIFKKNQRKFCIAVFRSFCLQRAHNDLKGLKRALHKQPLKLLSSASKHCNSDLVSLIIL